MLFHRISLVLFLSVNQTIGLVVLLIYFEKTKEHRKKLKYTYPSLCFLLKKSHPGRMTLFHNKEVTTGPSAETRRNSVYSIFVTPFPLH